ncbi:MAG: hypothetical protein H7338_14265 [Candidatus Sericytochromatia bacterium]|nr:hypothetical protein [Candidatus Sericytochromatia bacterium]
MHFLQIWIKPDREGIQPGYALKHFAPRDGQAKLRLVCSLDGRDHSVVIHQDANRYRAALNAGDGVTYNPQAADLCPFGPGQGPSQRPGPHSRRRCPGGG